MYAARNINWSRLLQLLCICSCLALPAKAPANDITDCNGNDIDDATEIAENPELDCNNNGALDICELTGDLVATGLPLSEGKSLYTGIVYRLNPLNGQLGDIATSDPEEVLFADIAINPTNGQIITVELSVVTDKLLGQRMFKVNRDAGTVAPLANLILDVHVLGLTFGPDGRLYGTASGSIQSKGLAITGDRLVRLDPANGGLLETLQTDLLVLGLATSPDGVIYSLGFSGLPPAKDFGDVLLRTHNPDTGAVTSEIVLTADSLEFSVQSLYGIGFAANGVLYAIGTPPDGQKFIDATQIFSINTTSGLVTRVSFAYRFLTGLGGSLGAAGDCNKNGVLDECDAALLLGACPEAITVQAPDETGLVVEYPTPPTENGCNVVVTVEPPSGTLFPIGTTTVTVTATDDLGAEVSCSFDVTVLGPDEPAPQPTTGAPPPPFCLLFLFQSTCGVPLCGPCFLAGMVNTFIGLLGLRWYVRRRYTRRRQR
ncbi:MAG: HYR domain-containing protein [Planctomycetota bacterium]